MPWRENASVPNEMLRSPQFELLIGSGFETQNAFRGPPQLRTRQTKHLSFVKLELHKRLHMTKYAEREPHTVAHKQKISAAGKMEA